MTKHGEWSKWCQNTSLPRKDQHCLSYNSYSLHPSSGAEPDLLDTHSCTKVPALSILDPSNRIPDLSLQSSCQPWALPSNLPICSAHLALQQRTAQRLKLYRTWRQNLLHCPQGQMRSLALSRSWNLSSFRRVVGIGRQKRGEGTQSEGSNSATWLWQLSQKDRHPQGGGDGETGEEMFDFWQGWESFESPLEENLILWLSPNPPPPHLFLLTLSVAVDFT